jgi:hypothetical protein
MRNLELQYLEERLRQHETLIQNGWDAVPALQIEGLQVSRAREL